MAASTLFFVIATAAAVAGPASACLARNGKRKTIRPPISSGRCPQIRPNYTLDRDQGNNSALLGKTIESIEAFQKFGWHLAGTPVFNWKEAPQKPPSTKVLNCTPVPRRVVRPSRRAHPDRAAGGRHLRILNLRRGRLQDLHARLAHSGWSDRMLLENEADLDQNVCKLKLHFR